MSHALADLASGAVSLPSVTVSGDFSADCVLVLKGQIAAGASLVIRSLSDKPLRNVCLVVDSLGGGLLQLHLRGDGARFELGHSHFFNGDIFLLEDSDVRIGRQTSANNLRVLCRTGSVVIGEDGMIGGEVVIEAAQHHGLVDLTAQPARLVPRRSDVRVGDHVWLGTQSLLLDHCQIGPGSVLGAGSVAAGQYGANTVIAGNPARVIRTDTTWSREADQIDRATAAYAFAAQNSAGAVSSAQSNATPT